MPASPCSGRLPAQVSWAHAPTYGVIDVYSHVKQVRLLDAEEPGAPAKVRGRGAVRIWIAGQVGKTESPSPQLLPTKIDK